MKTLKFNHEWFVLQFGQRPKRSFFEVTEDITDTRRKLHYLEKELFNVEIYMAKEDAALKTFVHTVYQIKK